MARHKHLTYTDRLRIEVMLRDRKRVSEIAAVLDCCTNTIYNEIRRGRYTHMNTDLTTCDRYSADISQALHDERATAKGAPLKLGNDYDLARYIEDRIVFDKYSPAAVLGEIKAKELSFNTSICVSTLYSYIDKGVFLRLSNRDLPVKGKRRRAYRKVRRNASRAPRGESIERRPEEIEARATFGDWEMDCVMGRKQTSRTLLVMTERKTRYEIIVSMRDKTAASVVSALDRLERSYGQLFPRVF